MKVQFSVKMKAKYMYDFLISHIYKSFIGLFSVLIGAAAIGMALYSYHNGTSSYIFCYIVVALLALFYPPVMLWMRAKQQVRLSLVFKNPSDYEVGLNGIKVTQNESDAFAGWEELYMVRSTGKCLIVYMDKKRAMIWPKEYIGDQYGQLVELIHNNMPSKKVKIR